jgi:hypothetical protein
LPFVSFPSITSLCAEGLRRAGKYPGGMLEEEERKEIWRKNEDWLRHHIVIDIIMDVVDIQGMMGEGWGGVVMNYNHVFSALWHSRSSQARNSKEIFFE